MTALVGIWENDVLRHDRDIGMHV